MHAGKPLHQSLVVGDAAVVETCEKRVFYLGIRLCHPEVIAEFAVMNVILGVSLTRIDMTFLQSSVLHW